MGMSECGLCLFQMERRLDWIPVFFQVWLTSVKNTTYPLLSTLLMGHWNNETMFSPVNLLLVFPAV